MTLETQKLQFIESYLKIDDINLINKLQNIINDNSIRPMSLNAYYQMVEESIKQHENGEVYTEEEADKLFDSWK